MSESITAFVTEHPRWLAAARALHQAALLLGTVQRLTQPPLPLYLELGLAVQPDGLSTASLPSGGCARINLVSSSLEYVGSSGARAVFRLNGMTQAELFDGLFTAVAEGDLAGLLPADGDLFERVSAAIAARGTRYRPPVRETLLGEDPIRIDNQDSRAYADTLNVVFTGIARFRARRLALMTPLVVWPEHFDLSTLWFAGRELDDNQPHMNFGFAPCSDGLEFPYLYAYAYPLRDGFRPPSLPDGASWHTQGWTGMVMPLALLVSQADPVIAVEESCELVFKGLLPWLS